MTSGKRVRFSYGQAFYEAFTDLNLRTSAGQRQESQWAAKFAQYTINYHTRLLKAGHRWQLQLQYSMCNSENRLTWPACWSVTSSRNIAVQASFYSSPASYLLYFKYCYENQWCEGISHVILFTIRQIYSRILVMLIYWSANLFFARKFKADINVEWVKHFRSFKHREHFVV